MARDPAQKIWRTADGRKVHVEQMDKIHVWNTILLIQREISIFEEKSAHLCSFDGPCPTCDNNRDTLTAMNDWLEVFRVELARRGLPAEPDLAELEAANEAYELAQSVRRLAVDPWSDDFS